MFLLILIAAGDTNAQIVSQAELYKSIVSIGTVRKSNGKRIHLPAGTGIITYTQIDSTVIPLLITAKHVVDSLVLRDLTPRIRFFDPDQPDNLGLKIPFKGNVGEYQIRHPNEEIDLACLPLYLDDESLKKIKENVLVLNPMHFAREEDYIDGARVQVYGFPGSVRLPYRNKPIVRHGIISWTSIKDPHRGKFLIDCHVHEGNSGGPVFSYPEVNIDGNKIYRSPIRLLGLVSHRLTKKEALFGEKGQKFSDSSGQQIHSKEDVGLATIVPASHVHEIMSFAYRLLKHHYKSGVNHNVKMAFKYE